MRTPSSLHHILAAILGGTAIAAGVFACGGSDASAVRETLAASGASLASRPHTFETSDEVTRALGLGTHRRYALRLSSSTDAGAMQLQVAIRGELDVAFVDSPAGGSRFRIALSTLTLEGNAFGPVDGDTARVVVRELEQPFFVTFEPSGRVRELHVPATKSSTIAGLRKNVAALLQYEVRGDSAWTSTEDDATGSFESAYTLTSGRELSRAKKRYTALFTPEGPTPIVGDTTMEVAGTFVATLDRGFWPREAKLDERASLRVGTLMSATSEHHDRLELLDSGDERVHVGAFAREGSGYETVTFRSLEIFAAQREALDHGYLRGRNAQQLLEEAASEDATVGNDALVGLTALFRLSPQSVRDVAATLRRYDIVTQRFIGAAVAAETAEAQAVVSEMALDRRLPLAQRRDAVMGLAMIEHPDASTLAAARRLVNDANREIADTAELALGAVAGRARAEAPEEANDAVNVLLERLRHASSAGELDFVG